MTLAGVLWGLKCVGRGDLPVLGVMVGASPVKRLYRYAPMGAGLWSTPAVLVQSRHEYHDYVAAAIGDLVLDPVYEAKCEEWLLPGDLLWVVGHRDGWAA